MLHVQKRPGREHEDVLKEARSAGVEEEEEEDDLGDDLDDLVGDDLNDLVGKKLRNGRLKLTM